MAAVTVGLNLYAWQRLNWVIPLAPALVLLALLYLLQSSYGYFAQTRRERWLARLFGQYVPRELVTEMSRRPGGYGLGGESREMTVLFSDIQDFTTVSETLEPRQLTQLMQFILTPLTQAIHEQRGTVDKYIGDAIMAFWGHRCPIPIMPAMPCARRWRCGRGWRHWHRNWRPTTGRPCESVSASTVG